MLHFRLAAESLLFHSCLTGFVSIHSARILPIYLVYWTAWVDRDGGMNFRHDIYGRDTWLNSLFGS
jgi:murein L,D-transpeptidase YcbB/YkuD